MNDITDTIILRKPDIQDGNAIYTLIKSSPPLDLNSPYCYLLICRHFSETSVLAETGNGISGFISAYIPPSNPDTLFVWQVAVHERSRKQGLATMMLSRILARPGLARIQYIETTVTPSNRASETLFRRYARKLGTSCTESVCFPAGLFGSGPHEEEVLFRIGPLKK